jgi:hypothetical protein
VLFCERNAAASGVKTSANPNVIHFEVVKKDYMSLPSEQKFFFQGEVLVPDFVPAHLIRFPTVDAFNRCLTEVAADRRLGGTSESAGLTNRSEHEILSPEPVETKSEADCSDISCAGSIPCGVADALGTSLPETKSTYQRKCQRRVSMVMLSPSELMATAAIT